MKAENLARGLKLLALECNGDRELADKLWSLRKELITRKFITAQADSMTEFATKYASKLEYARSTNDNAPLVESLYQAYMNMYNVTRFIAQHCVNRILGVSK